MRTHNFWSRLILEYDYHQQLTDEWQLSKHYYVRPYLYSFTEFYRSELWWRHIEYLFLSMHPVVSTREWQKIRRRNLIGVINVVWHDPSPIFFSIDYLFLVPLSLENGTKFAINSFYKQSRWPKKEDPRREGWYKVLFHSFWKSVQSFRFVRGTTKQM